MLDNSVGSSVHHPPSRVVSQSAMAGAAGIPVDLGRSSPRLTQPIAPALSVGTATLPLSSSLNTALPLRQNQAFKESAESHRQNPALKFAVGGAVTWGFELAIGHAIEFLKIAKQTSTSSYAHIFREITSQKGLWGVWDGFFPWGSIQAIAKGAVFSGAHAAARRHLDGRMPNQYAEIVSGGVGGGVQGLVLSPLLLLKTRIMTDPHFRTEKSMMASFRVGSTVVKAEGLRGLMKGSFTFSMKRVADWTTRYAFVEMLETQYKKNLDRPLTLMERSTCSVMGGCLSALVTLPMDVMVAQLQSAGGSQKGSIKSNKKGGVLMVVAKEMGWRHATRGLVARLAHVGLTTLVLKNLTNIVYGKVEKMYS